MGSSSAPSYTPIQAADPVVAAVAKDPNTGSNDAEQQASLQRRRGITSTYARDWGAKDDGKSKLGA